MFEVHDLAAPYVLDALDDDERARFEAHLESCAACRAEVAGLAEGAADIAATASDQPPPSVKTALMAAIAEPEPAPAVVQIDQKRPLLAWTLTAAAAVVALVFLGLWTVTSGQLDEAERIAAVYEAPDATLVEIDSATGASRLVFSPSLGVGVFNGGMLEDIGEDEVYQLWLIGDQVSPAGTLQPGESVLVEDVSPGLTFAMTIETAPGVDTPTSDPLFGAEL